MKSKMHHRRSTKAMTGCCNDAEPHKVMQKPKNPIQYAAEEQILLIEQDRNYVAEIKFRSQCAIASLMANRATVHEINVIATAHNMVCGIASIMKLSKAADQQINDLLERSSLAFKDLWLRSSNLLDPSTKLLELTTLNELTDKLDELLKVVTVRQFELGVTHYATHSKEKPRIVEIS